MRFGIPFDEFVLVAFALLPRRFLAKLGQAFEQVWNFTLISGFSQPLDEMIECGLILGIALERLPRLLNGFLIVSRLEVESCQDASGSRERRLQGDRTTGRA